MVVDIRDRRDDVLTLARKRNANKKERGTPTQKVSKTASDFEVHVEGLKSEFAFEKAFDVPLNRDILDHGDDGFDFTLPGGITAETRHRTQRGRDFALFSTHFEDFGADIGILTWPSTESDWKIELVGWTHVVHFARHVEVLYFGSTPRYGLSPSNMLSIESLKAFVAQTRDMFTP